MRTPIERFAVKIYITTDCWEWIAGKNKAGYGKFYDGFRLMGAHQFYFQIFKGSLEKGKYICHSCDNPSCVNPAHLFIGTPLDNSRDMVAKGRAIGIMQGKEHHPISKITMDIARKIREMRKDGKKLFEIASIFGITEGNVSYIASGKTWREDESSAPPPKNER